MKTAMLGLLAETAIHPGTGRSTGIIDLPVAREAATDYPVIVGSSLKGALRDRGVGAWQSRGEEGELEIRRVFGTQEAAGTLLVSDARLLLLPIRSLTGSYRWVTCPHLIERFRRDLKRAGLTPLPPAVSVNQFEALASDQGPIYLEEREFLVTGKPPEGLIEAIRPLIVHEETRSRLERQLVVLHDNDFSWFARYGLAVQARNQLNENKTSENLWHEESIPPDAVMYALVAERESGALDALRQLFPDERPYLQVGGNETVGQGWFAVTVRIPENAEGGAVA